jgi:hypothetical protein
VSIVSDLRGTVPFEPPDLLDLAQAKLTDGEARIQRVFEWQLERQGQFLTLAVPILTAALAGLVSPLFKGHSPLQSWQVGVLGGTTIAAAVIVVLAIRVRAHALYRRYLGAIELYGLLVQAVG